MKLLTWNIQWARGADGRVDLGRVLTHARRFADFDVLCLQEVSAGYSDLPGNDGADQFAAIAQRLPEFTPIIGIATDVPDVPNVPDVHNGAGSRRSFGNMLLSRLPVLQVFRHLLPWPAEAGVQSMQRIAVEASLQTYLGPVRVTTTHLEYYSARQRRAQIERLRLLQQEACAHARISAVPAEAQGPFVHPPRGRASILAGDFNFLPDSTDRTLMTSPIDAATPAYLDAWQIAHPSQAHAPTVGVHDKIQWPGPPFTFDFIFVSEDLMENVGDVRVDPVSDASDHQPLLIELRA